MKTAEIDITYFQLVQDYQAAIHRVDELIARSRDRMVSKLDWLKYLPRAAGSAELIARAESYLEEMRRRNEADGVKLWLSYDHDCQTRIFEVTMFRAFGGSLYCAGQWTELGQLCKCFYRGCSPDNIAFCGDIGLITEIAHPESHMTMDEMPLHAQAAADSDEVCGCIGAACFQLDPANGRTPIYRLSNNRMTPVN